MSSTSPTVSAAIEISDNESSIDENLSTTQDRSGRGGGSRITTLNSPDICWDVVFNGGNDEVSVEYLLGKSVPWSSRKMRMVFHQPNIIGMEDPAQTFCLNRLKRAQIVRAIISHIRGEGMIEGDEPAPSINFLKSDGISIDCSSFRMAEQLLQRPPRYHGIPLVVKTKAFPSATPQAFICQGLRSRRDLKASFAEYSQTIFDLIDTTHMIALSQRFRVGDGDEQDSVPAHLLVFFAGRLKEGVLPDFLGASPKTVMYPNEAK
ncbi:hypothetical protein sr13421 [Sporisorium reilianum SRZ2]|uniref:Uncharacterized protein n=1 Tax=Sporisorium reilianum (strain SRZ2) TaxID=999809 RepID=E6ZZW5_SPORE|nr:hypothetical protein sr13421 [Sporisorium reilianum SRZ2]